MTLTRWASFLALQRTFSTTSLLWMKTLNSTLRCLSYNIYVTLSWFMFGHSNRKLFSLLSNRFHILKSTWIKSATFWMVSVKELLVHLLLQYFNGTQTVKDVDPHRNSMSTPRFYCTCLKSFSFVLSVTKTNLSVHEDKNRVPYVKVCSLWVVCFRAIFVCVASAA